MSEEATLCSCLRCQDARRKESTARFVFPGPMEPGWSFACEKCGNKRCPHHSDHHLTCTGSNEPGQPGSIYA